MTHSTFANAKAEALANQANAQGELDLAIEALAKMPESRDRRQAVMTAQQKLNEATSAVSALDAVTVQVAAHARAADRATRVQRRKDEREQIRQLGPAVDEAATALLKHIERLGPLLAAYDKAARDHSELCLTLAREAEADLPIGRQHSFEQLLRMTDPNRGHLPEAVATAFWNVGLGRVGPHLEVLGLSPRPGDGRYQTDPVSAYLQDTKDLRRNVKEALDRADQRLAELDARAA